MNDERLCCVEGCDEAAAGVIAVDVYPYRALMDYYDAEHALSRLMTTLSVCEGHIPSNMHELFAEDQLKVFVRTVEATSGISVDPNGSKVLLVPFTDPDFQQLVRNKEHRDAIA